MKNISSLETSQTYFGVMTEKTFMLVFKLLKKINQKICKIKMNWWIIMETIIQLDGTSLKYIFSQKQKIKELIWIKVNRPDGSIKSGIYTIDLYKGNP